MNNDLAQEILKMAFGFKSSEETNQTQNATPYEVGEKYFIRTVTHHYTGKLKRITNGELVLTDAAWIADSGRFHNALKSGDLDEVEPYPNDVEVIINRDAICDASKWQHDLPLSQK